MATIGRYALHSTIGSGGMASVFLARVTDGVGFSRAVAVKRLHPHFAHDPHFVQMFLDEARLAIRVRHANVVSTLEAVASEGEVFLVMDYVVGESLGRLMGALREDRRRLPPRIASSIVAGALEGMHAAHEATDEAGAPLHIVHRDVSPQNILVGADGVARVLDFGVAKAVGQRHATEEGQIKGKLRYMAPEQLTGGDVDRRVDVCAAGIVLWEALTGRVLFDGANPGQIVTAVLSGEIRPPGAVAPDVPPALDAVVLRALSRNKDGRFTTAREMAIALEAAVPPASPREVGDFMAAVLGPELRAREAAAAAMAQGVGGEARKRDEGASTPASLGTNDSPSEDVGSAVRRAGVEPDTVVATASATIAVPARPGARSRARVAAFVALATLPALAAFWLVWRPSPAPHSAATARASATADAALSSSATAGQTPASAVEAPAEVSPAISAAPAPAAPSHGGVPPSRSAPRPAAAPKPDCRNPFRIDARGYRVPRPECFH